MKSKVTLVIFLFLFNFANGEKLELNGIFLGKNIYVMNPFSDSGVGFSVYKVTVNGMTSTDEINSSSFEVDLSKFNFPIGEKINITLHYKNGCLPKITNAECIKPVSSFNLQSAVVDKKGFLNWTTKDELGSLPFIVQQYRWNKWITIGEVEGIGLPQLNKYQLNVRPNSGKNTFRIYQLDYTEIPNYSSDIKHQSDFPTITFGPEKIKDELLFSNETLYEIYDNYGNIVFRGFGNKIKLEGLQNGLYYINYDNTIGSFRKK